jgi:Leucine-rich repeat (LRR) protein
MDAFMQATAIESSGSEYIADISGQFIANIDNTAFDKFLLLRSVNVSFNALEKINGLQQLNDLRELRLNNNKIAFIGGLEKCKKLERLHLQNNAVKRITGLMEAKFLKQLRLDNNQIEVYEGLDKCLSLEDLDLSRNCIRTIAGIKSRSMTTLRMSNNELSEIKLGDLAGVQALEELHLDGNRLWAAPGLCSLTNLMVSS